MRAQELRVQRCVYFKNVLQKKVVHTISFFFISFFYLCVFLVLGTLHPQGGLHLVKSLPLWPKTAREAQRSISVNHLYTFHSKLANCAPAAIPPRDIAYYFLCPNERSFQNIINAMFCSNYSNDVSAKIIFLLG